MSILAQRLLANHWLSHPCLHLHNHRSPTHSLPFLRHLFQHRTLLRHFLHPRPYPDGASERGVEFQYIGPIVVYAPDLCGRRLGVLSEPIRQDQTGAGSCACPLALGGEEYPAGRAATLSMPKGPAMIVTRTRLSPRLGTPFKGSLNRLTLAAYLAGGVDFGLFISRNLTPCADGKPAGLTFGEFCR